MKEIKWITIKEGRYLHEEKNIESMIQRIKFLKEKENDLKLNISMAEKKKAK